MLCEGVISQESHVQCGGIWDKLTSSIFWNFKISLSSLETFQKFQKTNSMNLVQIYTSTNWYYFGQVIFTIDQELF